VINVTCDRALLGAYTQETRKVTASLVRRAAGEVYGRRFVPAWLGWLAGAVGLVGIAGTALVGWQLWQKPSSPLHTSRDPAAPVEPGISAPAAALAASALPPASPPSAMPVASLSAGSSTSPSAGVSAGVSAGSSPAPVATSINALLTANGGNTTDAAAFRRLLSLWGTAMADDKDPCGQAAKAGLSCLEQRGSWAQVKALNRPAILTLTDDRGQRHRVVLSALDDKFATLNLGEHNERVPLDELSRDWCGEFTVVWKPKTARARLLSLGMKGDEVRWLRRSLNALQGAASDPESGDVYDQELATAVQNFQREHRLNVDGIAGLQTQVVLDTALAEPGSPLLLPNTPRGS
jgi:general secretion pathway protein A